MPEQPIGNINYVTRRRGFPNRSFIFGICSIATTRRMRLGKCLNASSVIVAERRSSDFETLTFGNIIFIPDELLLHFPAFTLISTLSTLLCQLMFQVPFSIVAVIIEYYVSIPLGRNMPIFAGIRSIHRRGEGIISQKPDFRFFVLYSSFSDLSINVHSAALLMVAIPSERIKGLKRFKYMSALRIKR